MEKTVDKWKHWWYSNIAVADNNKQTAKKNLDNWTIDNDPEDSLKEKIQNGYQIENRWYQTKNSKTGKEKLVVFLTGLKLVFKSREERQLNILRREFDPGSGWTLAACLTHASRTKHFTLIPSGWLVLWLSGGRVSNAWVTCPIQGDNR